MPAPLAWDGRGFHAQTETKERVMPNTQYSKPARTITPTKRFRAVVDHLIAAASVIGFGFLLGGLAYLLDWSGIAIGGYGL